MTVPKSVLDTIAGLRSERLPLASRLDAIDLAIDNLSRVYGLHGTPQPLPLEAPRKARKPAAVKLRAVRDTSGAEERRALLLSMIGKSDVGVTLAEIRKQTPKMDDKARTNALQLLRTAGKIKREGNAWTVAA